MESGIDALIEIVQAWAKLAYPGRLPTVIEVRFHTTEEIKILVPLITTTVPESEQTEKQLTPCEQDILALLESEDKRLKQEEVIAALSECEPPLHGTQTVRKYLSKLVREGYLNNDRDGRGYSLAEWD